MKKDVFIAVKSSSYRLSAQLAALLFLSSGLAAETPPPGEGIREAESATLLGSRTYDDPGASGGKAVGWMGARAKPALPALERAMVKWKGSRSFMNCAQPAHKTIQEAK